MKKPQLTSKKDLWMGPKRAVPKSDRGGRNYQLGTEVGRLETPGSELKSRGDPGALGARGSNAGTNLVTARSAACLRIHRIAKWPFWQVELWTLGNLLLLRVLSTSRDLPFPVVNNPFPMQLHFPHKINT